MRSQTETPKRYRYTGKERDEESGFYYHVRRYYACWLGRWTSCDPLLLRESTNLFQFARNNPVLFVDKNGTQSAAAHAPAPSPTGDDYSLKLSPQQAAFYAGTYSEALKGATEIAQNLAKKGFTVNIKSKFVAGQAATDASFKIVLGYEKDNDVQMLAYSASQTIDPEGRPLVESLFLKFEEAAPKENLIDLASNVLEGAGKIYNKVDTITTGVEVTLPLIASGSTFLPVPEKAAKVLDKALPLAGRTAKVVSKSLPYVEAGLTVAEGLTKSVQTGSMDPLERAEGRVAGTIAGAEAGEALGATIGGWVGGAIGIALIPFFGPLSPIVGVIVGEAIGAVVGAYFGGKYGGDIGEKAVEEGQKHPSWHMARPLSPTSK